MWKTAVRSDTPALILVRRGEENTMFRKNLFRRGMAALMSLMLIAAAPIVSHAATNIDNRVIISDTHPWLFLSGGDGESLETYQRTNLFKPARLERAAANIHNLKNDIAEATGAQFILMIVPGKESIYSEYMPADIPVMDNEGRTMQFIRYMHEHYPDVEIVYPYEEMMQAKEEYPGKVLYLESDNHWNFIGSFVGTRALLTRISLLTGASYQPEHRDFVETGHSSGIDLASMMGLQGDYWSTMYQTPAREYTILEETKDPATGDVIRHAAASEAGMRAEVPVNLYFIGDSFRHMMSQYLFEWAAKTTVVNRFYFNPDDMIAEKPNVVVYEMTDRHLGELTSLPGYNTAALN